MIRFMADLWSILLGRDLDRCRHVWVENALGHRHCAKCPAHQMLYENKYPEAGEPKYEWH